MLNEQQLKKQNRYPRYREICSKLSQIMIDIENLDCVEEKDYNTIEIKINQIKNKLLKAI